MSSPRISRGLLLGVVRVVGELDPAGLAAPARQHLGLDDDLAAELLGGGARLLGRRRQPPLRDGDAEAAEELLALVLVEIHRRRTLAVERRSSAVASLARVDAIVVDELRKRYEEVQALDGVSFAVRAGEVFGLLGPNGAGKSTTVRVLATLTQPDAGPRDVAGHDVVREPDAVRRTIGYVPQDSGVDRDAHRPREPAAPGPDPGHGGRDAARARRRAARARRASPTPPTGSCAATRAG